MAKCKMNPKANWMPHHKKIRTGGDVIAMRFHMLDGSVIEVPVDAAGNFDVPDAIANTARFARHTAVDPRFNKTV